MKYFTIDEFRCRCGCGYGYDQMDPRLLQYLDIIRENIGKPMLLNSACRCAKHNKAVGGVGSSEHVPENTDTGLCTGVDVYCPDSSFTYALLKEAYRLGIPRIGINFAKNFVHLGLSTKHPCEVLFKY